MTQALRESDLNQNGSLNSESNKPFPFLPYVEYYYTSFT